MSGARQRPPRTAETATGLDKTFNSWNGHTLPATWSDPEFLGNPDSNFARKGDAVASIERTAYPRFKR
ncbi:MAG: hypothetical protein ACREDR_15165, partial [Blastocatellia bacterium]